MMERLIARGDELAKAVERRNCARVAQSMRRIFGEKSVAADAASVTLRARGLVARWLSDPALRFFAGAFK